MTDADVDKTPSHRGVTFVTGRYDNLVKEVFRLSI